MPAASPERLDDLHHRQVIAHAFIHILTERRSRKQRLHWCRRSATNGGPGGIRSRTARMAAAPSVPGEGGVTSDRDEFTSFYASSFARLWVAVRHDGDQAEAQDVVQEAFVRAWARRSTIDRAQAPEAWVRVTAWRIAASRWRRARNGARLSLLTARPESIEGPDPARFASSTPCASRAPNSAGRWSSMPVRPDRRSDRQPEPVRGPGRSRPGWLAQADAQAVPVGNGHADSRSSSPGGR